MKSRRCRIYSISTVEQACPQSTGTGEHIWLKYESSPWGSGTTRQDDWGEIPPRTPRSYPGRSQRHHPGKLLWKRCNSPTARQQFQDPGLGTISFQWVGQSEGQDWGEGGKQVKGIYSQLGRTSSRGLLNRLQYIMVWKNGQCRC